MCEYVCMCVTVCVCVCVRARARACRGLEWVEGGAAVSGKGVKRARGWERRLA